MNQISPKLVKQVMAGDQAALGDLLQQTHKRLYNVCLRMVSNRDDAAELTQDAMLKIVEHVGDYNGKSQITTWMIRIAMNLCISHLRKQKLRRHPSLDAPMASDGHDDQASSLRYQLQDTGNPAPDVYVQDRELIRRMYAALDELDEDFRAVIVLRDLGEMDYAQMADSLDVPVGTVKSRLFRARLALRQAMSGLDGGVEGDEKAAVNQTPADASKEAERE